MSTTVERIWDAANAGDEALLRRCLLDVTTDENLQYEKKDVSTATTFSALGTAAYKGRTDLVTMLVRAGSDVNYRESQFGYTALMRASQHGHTATVQVLIEAGADPNLRGQALIEAGAELDLHNQHDGWTALMTASYTGDPATVQLLLDAGANRSRCGQRDKRTAADLAKTEDIRTLIETFPENAVLRLRQELSSLTAANASLVALCEEEKRQRLMLTEQVAFLQQDWSRLSDRLEVQAQAVVNLPVGTPQTVIMRGKRLAGEQALEPTQPAADDPLLGSLVSECDSIIAQFAHVPALRDAIQQRDELQAQLEATEKGDDFVLVGTLGEQLEAVNVKITEQPLSEEDYLALFGRRAALVQKVTEACRELTKAKVYAEVKLLGAKLQELKALDVSVLPQSWTEVPVQPPAPCAPATAEAGEDDGANDPVYMPPTTDEVTLA